MDLLWSYQTELPLLTGEKVGLVGKTFGGKTFPTFIQEPPRLQITLEIEP